MISIEITPYSFIYEIFIPLKVDISSISISLRNNHICRNQRSYILTIRKSNEIRIHVIKHRWDIPYEITKDI